MRVISPVLKRILYPAMATAGYLRRLANNGIAVVTYHGVVPNGYRVTDPVLDGNLVTCDTLRRHIRFLKSKYSTISPEQFRLWLQERSALPTRAVLLTCDDGLQNTLEMLPVLESEGVSCLFFVTGACLEARRRPLWHEELFLMLACGPGSFTLDVSQLGEQVRVAGPREKRALWAILQHKLSRYDAASRERLLADVGRQLRLAPEWLAEKLQDDRFARRFLPLDKDGLLKLQTAGMTIGAHSVSHPVLRHLTEDVAWDEIARARADLELAVGQHVWAFAYPFGDPRSVGSREIRLTERAGYGCAFLNGGGGFSSSFGRFAIPRVHVTAAMADSELEAHITGFYGRLRAYSQWGSQQTCMEAPRIGATR